MRVQTHWSFAPFNLIWNEPSMEFKEGPFVNRADFFEERRHSHCDEWHGSDSKNVPPLGLRGTNDIYISTLKLRSASLRCYHNNAQDMRGHV